MADIPMYEIPEELTGGEGYAPGGLYEKAVEESVDADNEWLAKAAVVGLGIHGLGRLMKYNVYAALANKFGKLSRYAETFKPRPDQVSLGRYTNLLRTLGGAAKLSGAQLTSGTRLGDISIVQDLAATLDKAGDPNSPYTNSLIKKSRAWYNTLQSMEPEVGPLHRDLDYLRISDIIDPNSPYLAAKSHSKLEVDVLRKAVEKKIVSPDLILDPRIHKDATNKVIDSRALSPFGFFEDLEKIFNPFGLTTALKSFSQNPRSFAVVGDITEQNADMIFIGGNVYKADQLGLQLAESNKILGHIGDSRHTAALVREHPQVIKYNKGYVPTWYEKLQDSIGVGTKFHEKRGGLIQTAGTFVKNLYGVATGQAELYGKEYKYRHENIYTHFITPYQFTDPEFEKIGKDIIKSKFGEGRLDPTAVVPKRGVLKGARGLLDRAKAYAGISGDLAVVKSEALDRIENPKAVPLSKEDLYVQYGRAGLGSTEKTIGKSPGAVQSLTVLGQKEYVRRPEYYAASGNSIDRIYDFANWMTIRMNKLSSASLLGVGFRPSGNILANVGRLATIPFAYYFGKEAIEYADYGIEKTLGKGPIEMAADLYTSARVAQQEARESLGITEAAETFENRMFPGLNFGLLGSIAAGIAGVKNLEKGAFFKALLSSGLIYGAAGGPDVTQSADSLKREYSGEEKVEVRKGRWWLLGYQPFSGGQVDYYKPSWYTELKQRPFDTNVYGSRENYWKHGSALPTPSNWFGLRTLIDPYAVERMNYYDRPYPTTAKMFEEVPIIGPMLADTLGELIKPQKRMHIGEQTYMTAASNISQKGVPTNAARMLGIPEVPVSIIDLNRGENLADRLDKWANVGLEPTGVWKFALSLFGVKFGEDYQMASATNIGSVGRRFYDKNLGGGFGETEFIRRFLLSEYGVPSKINAQINPIANTMPRWLPGSTSDISGDRQYFVDFNKGDAYTKIPGGEYRLPGAGYESVNRMHSGVAGAYSDIDKFLILADVAPFSQSYYKYESIANKSDLSPYWAWKVQQAKDQREKKLQRYDFDTSRNSQDILTELNNRSAVDVVGAGWRVVYEEGLSNIPLIGAKLFPNKDPYETYVANVVEGETFADWTKPYETIIRPELYTTAGLNPILAAKRGMSIGAMMSSSYASFINPFPFMAGNPIGMAGAGALIGATSSLIRMGSTQTWEHGFVPSHVKKERETEEYLDYLKYAKFRYLEAQATNQGKEDLAQTFASQAKQTVNYGLAVFKDTGDFIRYQGSLNRIDRPFFDAFLHAPYDDREKILAVVPEHMQEVLSTVWKKQGLTPNKEPRQVTADKQALEYFSEHQLPSRSWAGWNPSVPDTAIRIKAVHGGINGVSDSMHRFGIFPAQTKEALVRFPFVEAPTTDLGGGSEASMRLMASNFLGKENPFDEISFSRQSSGSGPKVDWFSAYLADSRRDDVFTFFQDAYR